MRAINRITRGSVSDEMDVPSGNRRGYSSVRENCRETNGDARHGRKREYNADRFNRIIRLLIWTSLSNFVLSIPYLSRMSIYSQLTLTIDASTRNSNSEVFTVKLFVLDKIMHWSDFLSVRFYHLVRLIFILETRRVCLKRIVYTNKIQFGVRFFFLLKIYKCFEVSCQNNSFEYTWDCAKSAERMVAHLAEFWAARIRNLRLLHRDWIHFYTEWQNRAR